MASKVIRLTGAQVHALNLLVEQWFGSFCERKLSQAQAAREASQKLGFVVTPSSFQTALKNVGKTWPERPGTGRKLEGVEALEALIKDVVRLVDCLPAQAIGEFLLSPTVLGFLKQRESARKPKCAGAPALPGATTPPANLFGSA